MDNLPRFTFVRPEQGKRAAWVMAVTVHLLLAALLIYGVRWQNSVPQTVSVDLVSYLPPTAAEKPAAEPPPPIQPEPIAEKVQKAEPPPPSPRPADIQRKVVEKPKPTQVKPPEKPQEKIQPTVDPLAAMLKRETERMANRRNVSDVADRELAQLKASQAAKDRADYLSRVRGKIRGNIVLPPAINGNPEIVFVVTQLPSGEVLSVKLKTPSGNQALDTAVERAILKSSPLPLPLPSDPSPFPRELAIKYRPLDD